MTIHTIHYKDFIVTDKLPTASATTYIVPIRLYKGVLVKLINKDVTNSITVTVKAWQHTKRTVIDRKATLPTVGADSITFTTPTLLGTANEAALSDAKNYTHIQIVIQANVADVLAEIQVTGRLE